MVEKYDQLSGFRDSTDEEWEKIKKWSENKARTARNNFIIDCIGTVIFISFFTYAMIQIALSLLIQSVFFNNYSRF